MAYTTLQNTPITINLDELAKDTGWTFLNGVATHESCNSGYLTYKELLEVNKEYKITLQVLSISGGEIRIELGDDSQTITTTGFYADISLTSTTDGLLRIFSDANCEIKVFTYKLNETVTTIKQKKTVEFREATNKWISFLTYNPDAGTSLFDNTYVYKDGNMYVQLNESESRNNFFGTQYDSILKFVSNINKGQTKTFNSVAYEGNELLITTEDGITTSLAQVSELIDLDFLKDTLVDGVDEVKIYDVEGVYSANLLRDKNSGDIINGDVLKGSYVIIELITTNNNTLLLKNVQVNSTESKIGVR